MEGSQETEQLSRPYDIQIPIDDISTTNTQACLLLPAVKNAGPGRFHDAKDLDVEVGMSDMNHATSAVAASGTASWTKNHSSTLHVCRENPVTDGCGNIQMDSQTPGESPTFGHCSFANDVAHFTGLHTFKRNHVVQNRVPQNRSTPTRFSTRSENPDCSPIHPNTASAQNEIESQGQQEPYPYPLSHLFSPTTPDFPPNMMLGRVGIIDAVNISSSNEMPPVLRPTPSFRERVFGMAPPREALQLRCLEGLSNIHRDNQDPGPQEQPDAEALNMTNFNPALNYCIRSPLVPIPSPMLPQSPAAVSNQVSIAPMEQPWPRSPSLTLINSPPIDRRRRYTAAAASKRGQGINASSATRSRRGGSSCTPATPTSTGRDRRGGCASAPSAAYAGNRVKSRGGGGRRGRRGARRGGRGGRGEGGEAAAAAAAAACGLKKGVSQQ